MTITFEPGSVSNVTLSGGNLTGTNTSASTSTGAKGASADAKASGKWYFEVVFTGVGGGGNQGAGIGAYAATYANMGNTGNGGYELFLSGNVLTSSGTFLNRTGGTISAGNRIAFALDLDNSMGWVKNITTGGNWNNSGTADPANNVGGDAIPNVAALVPFLTWGGGSTGQAMTAEFALPMTGTIPNNFFAWDSTPPPPPYSYATVMA